MDWKVQSANNDIEQFLRDVREHFRASLQTSEYENTANVFHVTEAGSTLNLLLRCELLLANYSKGNANVTLNNNQCTVNGKMKSNEVNGEVVGVNGANDMPLKISQYNVTKNALNQPQRHIEDASYLDMSGGGKIDSKQTSTWHDDWKDETKSDKTFRCSARLGGKANTQAYSDDDFEDDDADGDSEEDENDDNSQNYDICQVSSQDPDETQKAITPELEPMQVVDCPYMDLPAGHLSIERATKYGQLQRVEKRLFFDQCKKYYCGVLNDWLLCYADGPTAAHPTITLYLKHNGIEIEHYGEGKRREVCFQITTGDPNKKFLFQANSEVDAKEWIIAIEAAIRGDTLRNIMKGTRKLPTPPIVRKLTFIGQMSAVPTHDCIYEEPSPLYQTENSPIKPPDLPIKKEAFDLDMANRFEYDIPKCPPQPIKSTDSSQTESETAGLLNLVENNVLSTEKIEFQTIVKDVHSKLSSQLSAGPIPDRLKKVARKTNNGCNASNVETAMPNSLPPALAKEHKKQRKSSTPNVSPQKSNNNMNNSNTSGGERAAVKSWFFNRLNKTTSSGRSTNSSVSSPTSPSKCKSEKENLLNNLELNDTVDSGGSESLHNNSSNPASPILKTITSSSAIVDSTIKSKVDLIIKEFENNAHMGILTMETLAGSAVASLSSFCDSDCNNYEPIMAVATTPSSFLKKV